jgi:hypothetical protein
MHHARTINASAVTTLKAESAGTGDRLVRDYLRVGWFIR